MVKFLDAIPKVISTLVSILVTLIVLNVGIFVYICTFTQLINAIPQRLGLYILDYISWSLLSYVLVG